MATTLTLSEQEYRALPIESYSSLKYLLTSPQEFLYYKSNPFKGSNATLLGTAAHHYLQGNRHLVTFSVIDKRKKEAYAEFEKNFRELAGDEGIIVPASFEKTLNHIMNSFNDLPKKKKDLFEGVTYEAALKDEYDGVWFKGKVDALGSDYVLEIKTSSQDVDPESFKQTVAERHYDLQAFMYTYMANVPKHYFCVVNTTAPFKVDVYKTSQETLESGKKKFATVITNYKRYIQNGEKYETDGIEEI